MPALAHMFLPFRREPSISESSLNRAQPMAKITLLAYVISNILLYQNAFGDDAGWHELYDVNPCAWALQRSYAANDSEYEGAVSSVYENLGEDLTTEMTRKIDLRAKYILGLHPYLVDLLSRAEVPAGIKLSEDARNQIKKDLVPSLSAAFLSEDKTLPAYRFVQWDLISTRIAELRYTQELANPQTVEVLFQGEGAPAILIIDSASPGLQARLAQSKDLKTPSLLIADEEFPLLPRLAPVVNVVRDRLSFEANPVANNGSLSLNTDRLLLTGGVSARRHRRSQILEAAHMALSFPGRREVTIEVDLDQLESLDTKFVGGNKKGTPLYVYSEVQLAAGGSKIRSIKELENFVRPVLNTLAVELTKEFRNMRITEENASDLRPDYSSQFSMKPLAPLQATYVFTRRDGKRIKLYFHSQEPLPGL